MSEIDYEDLISQTEAARLRGTSRQAISRLVQRDRLKVYDVGGKKLLSRKEVVAFENSQGQRNDLIKSEKSSPNKS